MLPSELIVWQKDNVAMRIQVDAQNLNNRLNLIDFAGLFSGNAIAPPRSLCDSIADGLLANRQAPGSSVLDAGFRGVACGFGQWPCAGS